MFRIVKMILCGDNNRHQLCKVQCKSNDFGCYWWIRCQRFVQLGRLWIEHILKELKPALNNTRKTGKINTWQLVPYPGLAVVMQDGATPHTMTVNNEIAFQGLREVFQIFLTQI